MVKGMGWTEGTGLGKQQQGDVTPISDLLNMTSHRSHMDMTGLGYIKQHCDIESQPWSSHDMTHWVNGGLLQNPSQSHGFTVDMSMSQFTDTHGHDMNECHTSKPANSEPSLQQVEQVLFYAVIKTVQNDPQFDF